KRPKTAARPRRSAITVACVLFMAPTVRPRGSMPGEAPAKVRKPRVKVRESPDSVVASGRDDGRVKILLVEDEDSIAEPLAQGLRREVFDVDRAATGAAASDAAPADCVLLDLRLPDVDGYDVCRALRERSDVPIIMVSARGEEVDRVVGLELGADDYVTKPFGLRELVARIHAVTRRGGSPRRGRESLRVGPLTVDLRGRRASLDGCELTLTAKEFDLLAALAAEPGAVVA